MAGFYSEDIVSEVIAANDIVDVVSGYVKLKRSGSGFMGCCPFHREKTPSFHVSGDKQLYHCFGCGAGGSVIQFVMNAEGLDFPDALRFLADRAGIRLPENAADDMGEKHKKKQRIYDMNRDAARFFRETLLSKQGGQAQEYLKARALTGKTIAAFGLGFSPPGWDGLLKHLQSKGYRRELMVEAGLCVMNEKGHVYDRFRNRVMFPIIDVRGNIIGFGGRILEGDGAKYMNSPESIVYDKGKNLFALNIAKKSIRGYFILVEGYMDVISLHQAGIDAAVAGCGTALTPAQAKLISKSPVYLCYDSDEAGVKACERAYRIFREFDTRLRVITIPNAKDADEFIKKYGANAFEELIKKARTVTEYRLDLLLKGVDLNDAAQKIEVLKKAAEIFAEISSSVEREVYMNQLAAKSGISIGSIASEVRKINARNVRKEVNSDLRKTVGGQTGIAAVRKNNRRVCAEQGVLAMLAENEKAYGVLKDKLTAEMFSEDIHKEIYSHICEFYRNETADVCGEYLLAHMEGKEKELSAVLINSSNVSNPLEAAADFYAALENEIFNDRLQKAQSDGDIKKISELLKEKKQKDGR